jgi:hypothetical protein
MSQELDLKAIERKAWTSVFRDGLYDLFLGWLLLELAGVYLLTRTNLPDAALTAINLGTYGAGVALLYLGKRFITVPRAGRAQFGRRRITRLVLVGAIAFVIVTTVFALTVLAIVRQKSLLGEAPSPLVSPLLLGLFFLVLFGLPAFLLEYRRLYVIAVMFALPEIVRTLFWEAWGINLGVLARAIPAAVVIMMGLVTLRRFLREYPVPAALAGEPK